MDETTKTKINYEMSQIDELIDKSQVLFSLCKNREPDFIEITAIGGILHSFYNGLENIFVLIGKTLDFDFKSSPQWGTEILSIACSHSPIFCLLICAFYSQNIWDSVTSTATPTATQSNGKNALICFWGWRIFGRR